MDHSIAIECLKDDYEQAKIDANYLANGIASMMLRNASGNQRIRQDAILRWNRKLDAKQTKVRSLRATIKFLERHSTGGK